MSGTNRYTEFAPRPELKQHIECLWTMTSEASLPADGKEHRVLPDGCMDLIFDFGDDRRGPEAYFVGTMTAPILVRTDGKVDLLGIRFNPGGIAPFFRGIAAECTDDIVDIGEFWGKRGRDLWEELVHLRSTSARLSLAQLRLLEAFGWDLSLDPYVRYAVSQILKEKGNLLALRLENGTGISSRQLERKFARFVGIPPKVFARVMRFKSVVAAAQREHSVDWCRVAMDHGYCDQSHLIRDFKQFAGLSPTEFIAAQ